MSAAAAAVSRSWAVGAFVVTLTVARPRMNECGSASVEWSPHLPSHLSGSEVEQYRTGRDAAIAELSAAFGLRALVVDLP